MIQPAGLSCRNALSLTGGCIAADEIGVRRVPERSPDVVPPEPEVGTSDPVPSLSPEVSALIGESLRLYYEHMMREPVPDHLIRLVDRLSDMASESDGT